MNHLNRLLLTALSLVLVTNFYSCDDDDIMMDNTNTDLSFDFDYNFAGEEFAYDQVYDVNGTKASFQTVQFYVGGIKIHPEEGDAIVVTDYLLVKPTSGAQAVVTLEKKHYHELDFFVGVAAEDNDQTEADFDSRPADDPLARQTNPPMHWNWNAGYLFVRIDAMVDLDGDDVPETVMEYHLGTDNFKRDQSLIINTDIDQDAQTIGFDFDVAKLFNDLDISISYSMHTGDDPASAIIFADNIADAISTK